MIILAEKDAKIYGAITIDGPSDFAPPFAGILFPCLIWDHDGRFTDAQRAAVAKELLDAGCRYAVCAGQNCEVWHDAVDSELVRQDVDDPEKVREAMHVMTTWHAGESPDDVAFFFVLNTDFDEHEFTRYLVLHVGTSQAAEQVDAAVRRYALDKEAV